MSVPEWAGRPAEGTGEHRRVLVALGASGHHPAVEVGRIVARTLAAPLHGVLIWPTTISPCDVPHLLRCDPRSLEGMVIDVGVGDPIERLVALARAHPIAFVVLAAEETGLPSPCDAAIAALAEVGASAIVVRPHASLTEIRHILVPLDGTPATAAALEPASELAQRAGAAIDLLLIQDATRPPPAEPGTVAAPRYVDQPQHEWPAFSAEIIQHFVGCIGHGLSGIPVRFFLGAGSPAAEIVRYARELDPDLIALMWRPGREGQHGALLAEVQRCVRQPILVVRR